MGETNIPIPRAETELANNLAHEFASAEDPLLPAGVLVHNVAFGHNAVTGIADSGILPHELTGNKNPSTGAAVPNAVYVYEVPAEMTLSEYGVFCGTNTTRSGSSSALKTTMGQESTMFPGTVHKDGQVDPRRARNVAFLIDPSKVDPEIRHPEYDGMQGRSAAFIGGVPREAVAGIVAGADIAADTEALQLLHSSFPELAIRDSRGNLVIDREAPQESANQKLAKTVEIMKRFHAEEIFRTPKDSKEFLDSLNFEDFKRWLSFVNGIEREVPRSERGISGGSMIQQEVGLLGSSIAYRPPYEKQRERLLELAFEKSQRIDDPETAGLTLGFAINAIHPYPDGNGRTARITYALLSKGYDGSEGANDFYTSLLENTQGRSVVNPNPATYKLDNVISKDLRKAVGKTAGYADGEEPLYVHGGYGDVLLDEYVESNLLISPDSDISDQARQNLHAVLDDGDFTISAALKALGKDRLDPYTNTSTDGRIIIDGDRLVASLTEADITQLAIASVQIKGSYVKRLIDFSDRKDATSIVAKYRS